MSYISHSATVEIFADALAYARQQDYCGWDYCDGMSSRVRRWLPFETRATNLLFQETIKRFPVNIRPYLLVEERRNFLGIGLFAMANLAAHELSERIDSTALRDVDYVAEAEALLDWLVENQVPGYSGFCGSHCHDIQKLTHVSKKTDPVVVTTAIPAIAFLQARNLDGCLTQQYDEIAQSAADFIIEDLHYRTVKHGARIDYGVNSSGGYYTINGGALAARFFVELYETFGDPTYRRRATKMLDYIAHLQTDRGGWYYRHPPSTSHLSMDNFHNGFIIESLLRYGDVVDSERFADTIDRALEFYRTELFEPNGAPNHDEATTYPRDIHDVAQGIIVFTECGDTGFAREILSWGVENLYAGNGRFEYQQRRWYTKRFTLMRWCQAWMTHALGKLLTEWKQDPAPTTSREASR